MSKTLQKKIGNEELHYLSLLSKAKNSKRRAALINMATSKELNAILNCILHVLIGKIPLKEHQRKCLKRHAGEMRKLTQRQKKVSQKSAKARLVKRGGFIGTLLSAALPLLMGVGSSILGR